MSSKGFSLLETLLALGILSIVLGITSLSIKTIKNHDLLSQKFFISQQLHSAKILSYQTQTDQLVTESESSVRMIGYNSSGRTKFSGTSKKNGISLVSLGIGIGKITIK